MTTPDVFDSISDPTRRKILKLLTKRDMSIVSITEHFKMTRSGVKKHLDVLFDSGLVVKKPSGRETIYSIRPDPLLEIKDWLSFFNKYWDDKVKNLKDLVESDK